MAHKGENNKYPIAFDRDHGLLQKDLRNSETKIQNPGRNARPMVIKDWKWWPSK